MGIGWLSSSTDRRRMRAASGGAGQGAWWRAWRSCSAFGRRVRAPAPERLLRAETPFLLLGLVLDGDRLIPAAEIEFRRTAEGVAEADRSRGGADDADVDHGTFEDDLEVALRLEDAGVLPGWFFNHRHLLQMRHGESLFQRQGAQELQHAEE